ncbi:hypothetical protein CVV67_14200 [Arthrobacter stackebrandtii]|nr:hypothetical protein CVV67_14200 [Arthrobacter stackebrandtii]
MFFIVKGLGETLFPGGLQASRGSWRPLLRAMGPWRRAVDAWTVLFCATTAAGLTHNSVLRQV